MICKSCKIKFDKLQKEFKLPTDRPLSKEMVKAVNEIREQQNGRNDRQFNRKRG